MERKLFKLNDQVVMKKAHACGGNLWLVIRVGVDVKLRCLKCGHDIMMDRLKFERKLKMVIGEEL